MAAVLQPYTVSVGGSPACYGILGCLFVELFQNWKIIESAFAELFKLLLVLAFAIGLGLLPYVDQMANMGGLICGVLSAFVFLPYITFGKWDIVRKRILFTIGFFGFIFFWVFWNVLIYNQRISDCPTCVKFECYDFFSDFCKQVNFPLFISSPHLSVFASYLIVVDPFDHVRIL